MVCQYICSPLQDLYLAAYHRLSGGQLRCHLVHKAKGTYHRMRRVTHATS